MALNDSGKLFDAETLAATTTGKAMNIDSAIVVGLSIVATTGDANGTFAIQVSNDNSNWVTVSLNDAGSTVTSVAISGAAITKHFDLTDLGAKFMRVVYTASSGGGVGTACTIIAHRKQL